MTTFHELVREVDELTAEALNAWIERGWVRPASDRTPMTFSDLDAARVRMICDLCFTMRIEIETMPVVLDLIDQVYGLRLQLRAVSRAVADLPTDVQERMRERIADEMQSMDAGDPPEIA